METILGAGGPVARALAQELERQGRPLRLVRRNPGAKRPGVEVHAADLTDAEATERAVRGSTVCYLTVGLPYRAAVWARDWPRVMENAIAACRRNDARLVFFDNVYMYDPDHLGRMTEATPVRPVSRKGRVRARVVRMLHDAVERGEVEALVARSADFFGYGKPWSGVLNFLAFEPLSRGKKAIWFASADRPHNFTYLPDAARAMALLAQRDEAYGEVWHLPSGEARSGREWVEGAAAALGREPRLQLITPAMARLAGLFQPLVRETVEMLYQYDRPYVFDSAKIAARFGLEPTPTDAALAEVARRDYGAGGGSGTQPQDGSPGRTLLDKPPLDG